ncbi:phospholipase D-like domain-containing protein [Bradyrhizobium sp. dw_411]|uniref:phospholipase D-like domain-containing protein n=1 Tax=Bradyrhizobium sp. dw_411 TaxID=2720082 RepID=UPI001BCEFCF3|nr:phospholipase D-like domain-containing protein [Bradyrhizobium sp. dw_411]
MTIVVKAYANADDVLIAWQPDQWPAGWVGFQIERRNDTNQQITLLVNRIPPKAGEGPVQPTGISSAQSPIRRCIWTDHSVAATDSVSYRVTAMTGAAGGPFATDATSASAWTAPLVASGDAGGGLAAYFNRGTLMSQIVSRFVNGDVSDASLRKFLTQLATPGFPARLYLAGDALHEILQFLRDADRRGSTIHAAIYEMNDQELIDALKPFGSRGHIILGNGSATKATVAPALVAAGLDVKHRDLSHHGQSSPSVHNKFVVESDAAGKNASRVLTGSTNWTTTGLCTQMNNVLIVEDTVIAGRYFDQWGKLVAAGDDMPASLKASNSIPTNDNNISLYFAATNNEAEFKPVLDLIAGAREGALFLMFMPGQSPLLGALLDRSRQNDIYVRGVVSTMMPSKNGDIVAVGGQVVKSGAPAQSFHDNVRLPSGVTAQDHPSWADTEFNVQEMHNASMIAIVHSKAIVIDPFSDQCAVVTGSHNFSVSASEKNDENLVIIRGNTKLAQAYALHINGVYDHYSWRAFLGSGGDADQIYKPLDGWKPGGSRAQELDFWMNEPIPPQSFATTPKAVKKPSPARAAKKAAPVKAAKKSTAKKAKAKKTKTQKSTAKKSQAKKSKKAPKKSTAKKSKR